MGNNNPKPVPKSGCNFCTKESCRGDSCRVRFLSATDRSSSPQVGYGSGYSSPNPVPVARSTYYTSEGSGRGQERTASSVVPQSTSAIKQDQVRPTATLSQYGYHLQQGQVKDAPIAPPRSFHQLYSNGAAESSTGVYARSSIHLDNKVQERNSAGNTSKTSDVSAKSVAVPASYGSHLQHGDNAAKASTEASTVYTSSSIHLENKVQESNSTDNGSKTTYVTTKSVVVPKPYSSGAQCVSKPEQSLGTQSDVDGMGQSTSSVKVVNSSESLFSDNNINETTRQIPSLTAIEKKILENKATPMQIFPLAQNEERDSEVYSSKTKIEQPFVADFRVKDGVEPVSQLVSDSLNVPIMPTNGENVSVVDKKTGEKPRPYHSVNAVKYTGVVHQILGSRNAKVRVVERNGEPVEKSEWGSADAVHKFALLIVNKILSNGRSFYPSNTPISSVLSKGDVIGLICTPHNSPSSGFQLFAHEAWLTGDKSQINDADSVASFCSQTGSETQESTSSSAKKRTKRSRKKNKNVPNAVAHDANDTVSQWLDSNQYCLEKNEDSKTLKLITGCHYIGKVVELRLPYAFIVEISSNDDKQLVFVFSSHFYPHGISSPALIYGVSLEPFVNIGDEIVVIPTKNTALEEGKFEWVASKAWPKSVKSTMLSNANNMKKEEQLGDPVEGLNLQSDILVKKDDQQGETQSVTYIKSLYPSAKNWREINGTILSLQYDWGLVMEGGSSQSAYVFTRKNAYLFGMSLQHFILDDVLKEGQSVKFSVDTEEIGAMNAIAVWWGDKLPDFNSFDIAAGKYCEENLIKFETENSLIQHGKLMYPGN